MVSHALTSHRKRVRGTVRESTRLQKHGALLKTLSECSRTVQNLHISKAKKDVLDTLVECVQNIIKGNVPMSDSHFNALRKRRKDLRFLAHGAKTVKEKRKVLQKGGFLGMILKPLLGALGGLFGGGFGGGGGERRR